jgi:hypothetical protein
MGLTWRPIHFPTRRKTRLRAVRMMICPSENGRLCPVRVLIQILSSKGMKDHDGCGKHLFLSPAGGAAPAARERSDEGPSAAGSTAAAVRAAIATAAEIAVARPARWRRPRGGGYASGPGGARRRRFPRRKVCWFSVNKAEWIDYKDSDLLRRFVSDRGKNLPGG